MQLNCARVVRAMRSAFATPWEVCFNVAYPPEPVLGVRRLVLGRRAMDAENAAVVLSF